MTARERDRVFLVTGANTGIGRATAHALAKRGARVLVACRDCVKGAAAIASIRRDVPDAKIELVEMDLGSLDSVKRAAETVLASGTPLHVLVNNARVAGQRGVTREGFELQFGTNHVGHFLLTQLLLDRLRACAPSRIVNVASKAHYQARGIDWAAVRGRTRTFAGLREYEVSKLANVLFTAELSRRLEGTGVTAYALHPGVVASDAWRRIPWPVRHWMTRKMLSNDEGADRLIHCATTPEAELESGAYYDDCRPKEPNPLARDAELATELWQRSEEWVRPWTAASASTSTPSQSALP